MKLRSTIAVLSLVTLGASAGCTSEELQEAPADLQQSALWAWQNGDSADDAQLAAALKTLDRGVIEARGNESFPVQSRLPRLKKEDVAALGIDRDPSEASGLLVVSEIACALPVVERIVAAHNQTELYPGIFETYDRKYVSNDAEYFGRTKTTLDWTASYRASAITTKFDSSQNGKFRWVPTASPSGGPVLIVRTFAPKPATFDGGGDNRFEHDYDTQIFYEREPGKTLHLHAVWRQFKAGGMDLESDVAATFMMGAFLDYDNRTTKLCASGTPQPK